MFDPETERCWDCDGHFKHADWCPAVAAAKARREAQTIARATGSTGATVTYETRRADGTLTVDAVGSWTR